MAATESHFLGVKSIGTSKVGGRKPQTLLVALRHVRRELQAELGADSHINPMRSHLNVVLAGAGAAADVVARAHELMRAIGVEPTKMRRDYVQALELVFSLQPDTTVDAGAYFNDCHRWLALAFLDAPVLAFDVHHDEAAPHAHAFVLPVARGRYVGGALIARPELKKLHASFFSNVAGRYGFRRPHARLFGQTKLKAVRAVLAELERRQAPELKGALWPLTHQAIQDNPGPYLDALHINRTTLKLNNPIGIEMIASTITETHRDESVFHPAEKQSLCSVRVCQKKTVVEVNPLGNYIRLSTPKRTMFTGLLNVAKGPSDTEFQHFIYGLHVRDVVQPVGVLQ